MGSRKWTKDELGKFAEKIEFCLKDEECREILKAFLEKRGNPNLEKVWKIWNAVDIILKATTVNKPAKVNKPTTVDESTQDLIDETNIKSNPNNADNLEHIQQQCCQILDGQLGTDFSTYLSTYHQL